MIYDAFIYGISGKGIDGYEQYSVEADTKDIAWNSIIQVAFPDLFSTKKMIVLVEVITTQ